MIIDISRPLDESTAVFPGDVPFSREMTLRMDRGDSCNVSAVSGSSHAGTHVDLPYHFSADASSPALEAYIGRAVVIEVSDWDKVVSSSIAPGMRVLFKTTNSRTDYRAFDENFACITNRVVDWLVDMNAVLVGVDAPSVDPATSKDLANHRALCAAGIAILENLDLSAVEAGDYELIALPLRIPKADATWVRAVLRR